MILDGRKVRDVHVVELKEKIKSFSRTPMLAIIQLGRRDDSNTYVLQKKKWAEKVGIATVHKQFKETASESEVKEQIKIFNTDTTIDGIIVQLPLPQGLNSLKLIEVINPRKDVDGLTNTNQEKLVSGDVSGFVPATARGVFSLLEQYRIDIKKKKVVVIGRSRLVGAPIAVLARRRGAEVEVCHSQTNNTADIARTADILISATGIPGLVTKEFIKPGAVVIDVGISSQSGNISKDGMVAKKLVGDVLFSEVEPLTSTITPVPGGVGPMTVISLLENVAQAFEISNS